MIDLIDSNLGAILAKHANWKYDLNKIDFLTEFRIDNIVKQAITNLDLSIEVLVKPYIQLYIKYVLKDKKGPFLIQIIQ